MNVRKILFKTRMCKYYRSEDGCNYGERCWFAHGSSDMRPKPCNGRDKSDKKEKYENNSDGNISSKVRKSDDGDKQNVLRCRRSDKNRNSDLKMKDSIKEGSVVCT